MSDLAQRQSDLVAALAAGAPVPAGFDERLVGVARKALLRKRAGEVAGSWPMLAAMFGPSWESTFTRWAATRPTRGTLRDGWDFAQSVSLTGAAADEFAARAARMRYDGDSAPTPRRRWEVTARLWWLRLSRGFSRSRR